MSKLNIYIASLMFSLLLLNGCQENFVIEDPGPDPNEMNTSYDLLWEIPLRKDTIFDDATRTVLKGNELYYSRTLEGLGRLALDDEMVCLDKNTGDEFWTWYSENNGDFSQPVINEDKIFFENKNRYYSLDRFTGDVLFQGFASEGDLRTLNESGTNSLISFIQYGPGQSVYENKVVEISKQTGVLDTLLVREKDDEYWHYLNHPQIVINENGDRILLYFYSRIIWNPFEAHLDYIKYNLTQDTTEWVLRNFSFSNGTGTVTAPIILDGKIYIHTLRSVFCYDLHTAEELWRREYLYTNFDFTNFIINDNILNSISDEGHLIGIDIITGEELYIFDYGAMGDGITYYNERLYYASEDIFIADHKTGELLHKIPTKNENIGAFFINQVVIDEENEVMYAQDGFYLQAIRIPD